VLFTSSIRILQRPGRKQAKLEVGAGGVMPPAKTAGRFRVRALLLNICLLASSAHMLSLPIFREERRNSLAFLNAWSVEILVES
jgi:hypothetical protein